MTSKSVVATVARRFVGTGETGDGASGFVSFVAGVSILGLSLGVTALLIVTSVMNGFEKELQSALTAFHSHIILFSRGEPVANPSKYVTDIKKTFPEVREVSPYIFSEVMLSSAKSVSGAVIEGIEEESFAKVSRVPERFTAGRLPRRVAAGGIMEISLGSELARKLSANLGDTVVVTVPFLAGGGQPLAVRAVVSGVVKIGMYDYDSKYALVNLAEMQNFLGMGGKVNAFKILVNQADTSVLTAARLNDRYVYPLRARDWSSLNRNLFYAIKLEKAVISLILFVIILVASFNVVSTILMMINEKQHQVSMLKALGLRPRQTMATFLLIGGFMAVAGAALGVLGGQALCALLRWKSIIDLPADIYLLSRLPVEIRVWEWVAVAGGSICLALCSALWPSIKAGRQLPVEGLRHE